MPRTRRRVILATIGAVFLAAVATTQISSAYAETNGGTRVMPLGDSITDGFNVPGGYRTNLWQRAIAARYTIDFVGTGFNGPANLGDHDHEGHSGWRIDQLDANIVAWLQNTTPRTVLLHIGTNDVLQNVNLSTAPTRLSTLIDKITATVPNADVFVATIIPLTNATQEANVRTFNATIPGIVQTKINAGRHLHLVDMHSALTTSDLADGIHPTSGGYDKMAAVWFAALQSVPGSLGSTTSPTSAAATTRAPTSAAPTTRAPTSSVPTTRAPTSSVPTSSAPTGGARSCSATYAVVGQWPGGFQGSLRVTAGSSAITGWTLTWTFANGQTVTSSWGTTITSSGSTVTARNVAYNGSINAGANIEFGFLGGWNGTNSVPSVACAAI